MKTKTYIETLTMIDLNLIVEVLNPRLGQIENDGGTIVNITYLPYYASNFPISSVCIIIQYVIVTK